MIIIFLAIDPIAVELWPLAIRWYGVLIISGVLLGMWLSIHEAKKHGISPDLFVDLLVYAVPLSIIGARLYYVIFKWSDYLDRPADIIKVWEGGIAIHGALIAAVCTAIIFAKRRAVSFWRLADIAAPGLLIGQMIGRWGNFINQEAYGTEVTREYLQKLFLPDFIIEQMNIGGSYYHPTFLYESLWSLIGIAVLLLYRRTNPRLGSTFILYALWYSIGRYFIEGLRTDSLMLSESIRMAQLISIAIIATSVFLFIYRNSKVSEQYFK